jgi:hypothetical protein
LQDPETFGLRPSNGFVLGGTVVEVTGLHFANVGVSVILDGFNVQTLTVVSSTLLICTTPAHQAGAVQVYVQLDGATYISSGLDFEYLDRPALQRIAPSRGPEEGSTMVLVYGSRFIGQSGWACRFGRSTQSRAQWLSSTVLRCPSPSHSQGRAAVDITFNSVDYSGNGVVFEF